MKCSKAVAALMALICLLAACGAKPGEQTTTQPEEPAFTAPEAPTYSDVTQILLNDSGITVDGAPVTGEETAAVYTANDIVYYESGKDFIYGEGDEKDAHSAEVAALHTVVHITKPGAYSLSGRLSLGQIAVDLGDDTKKDPNAVVTLILDGVDITCQVAPAVIFYNVYECGSDDTDKASKDVDTRAAGANVIIADGTVNTVNGSYVAKIYEPESVILNGDNTKVEEAKKLHKYDAAFYSKRSMNIFGGKENTGILNINAENEGLDSELHLTLNGGDIRIRSGNDGINTNEDGVSVTTVNGGKLSILVTGETGEGDGIDSNGWLVINGGAVTAAACANSADAGIDSDMGIHINGGRVIATGSMLDRIEDGGQNYAVFNFAQRRSGNETVTLKDRDGKAVLETKPENAYSVLIYSSPELVAGTYTLWSDGKQLAGSATGMMGGMGRPNQGNQRPSEGFRPPEGNRNPEAFTPPEGADPQQGGQRPETDGDFTPPEGFDAQQGGQRPQMPGPDKTDGNNPGNQELTPEFTVRDGGNMFGSISLYSES